MFTSECLSQATHLNIINISPRTVKASAGEAVRLTCLVSPTSEFTLLHFSFNNTIYRDSYYFNDSSVGITVDSIHYNENCSLESTLTIEHFSQQFAGQYTCLSSLFGNSRLVGDNVTFNVTLTSVEERGKQTQPINRTVCKPQTFANYC